MELGCTHVVLFVEDLAAAKRFYADQLGLSIIEEHPTLIALRAGPVRVSIFSGGAAIDQTADTHQPMTFVFRTDDLDGTVRQLRERGVTLDGEIQEDPKFMRFASLRDPNGNQIYIGQYVGDPLRPPTDPQTSTV